MTRRIIVVLRLLLAAVFLYAAYTKLRQPWLVFAMSIDAYGFLPEWAVLGTARTLPWVELVIGLLLLAGVGPRYVSAAAAIVLAVFFVTMLVSYGKGMSIDCGCFGLGEALSTKTLIRDGILLSSALVLCALVIMQEPKRK